MFNFNNVVKFENKRFDVFAIGELLVDMISDDYDADNSCNKYSRYFGGSPANITMNIKRLGGNPIISASVGNDRLGEFLINNLKKNNIKLYILSNTNKHEKVKEVAKKLQIEYTYFAKKPLKSGFRKVQKILKEEPENIGVVGDQIFTDVVGGNRCKMFTILVEPIAEKDIWITLIKRPIENTIKKRYFKKQKQKKEIK